GFHATGRSAALFVPNYGSPLFRALTRASATFLQAPPAGFAAHPLLQPRGALYIARADQHEQLEHARRGICAANYEVEALSPAEARARVPCLRPDYVAAALYEPEVYDIDVAALLEGFLRQAKALGTHLQLAARCSTPQRQGEAWCIRMGDETLTAP